MYGAFLTLSSLSACHSTQENGVGETPASSNSFGAGAFLTASSNPRSLLPALAANATNKRAMSEVDEESVLRAEKKKRLAEETFSIPEISLTKVLFVNQWGMYESEETWTRIVSRDRIITSRKSPSSGKQESHTHSFATADVLETLSQHELYLVGRSHGPTAPDPTIFQLGIKKEPTRRA